MTGEGNYRQVRAFSAGSGEAMTWREALRDAVRTMGERWPEDVEAISNLDRLELTFIVNVPSFYDEVDLVVWTPVYAYVAAVEEGMGHVVVVRRHPSEADRVMPAPDAASGDFDRLCAEAESQPGAAERIAADVEAMNREIRDHQPGFTYSRTLTVPEGDGWRPYLLMVRDEWVSVAKFPAEATQAGAAEAARRFYQERLTTLPDELQGRFHAQVSEHDDPYALIARVSDTADLIRLEGIDWSRFGIRPTRVRALLELIEDGRYPAVGDTVLLAGDTFWDRLAVVESADDRWAVCRLESGQ